MLYIINYKNNTNIIYDVEQTFFLNKHIIKREALYGKIVKSIDNVLEFKGDYIETPFGGTSIESLSSGAKALLLAVNKQDHWVNFLEAGENVMNLAVEISRDIDLHIFCEKSFNAWKYPNELINFNGHMGELRKLAFRRI